MDPDLENVIRQALGDALDHLSQTELAVRAVWQVRPNMTASRAGGGRLGAVVVEHAGADLLSPTALP